jgi:hypothetical protein
MPDSPHTLEQTTHSRLADLTSADIADMRALLERHFDGVAAEQFEKDLMEKTDVLRVWRAGRLAGFSTLLACREQIDGEWLNLLYSGDTIMSPECWGSPVLARAWITMVKKVVAAMPPDSARIVSCPSSGGISGRAMTRPCRKTSATCVMRSPAGVLATVSMRRQVSCVFRHRTGCADLWPWCPLDVPKMLTSPFFFIAIPDGTQVMNSSASRKSAMTTSPPQADA